MLATAVEKEHNIEFIDWNKYKFLNRQNLSFGTILIHIQQLLHFRLFTSFFIKQTPMPQKDPLNKSRRQPHEKTPQKPLDFVVYPRKKYNQSIDFEERQPNFGIKKSYSDKENEVINYTLSAYQNQENSYKKPLQFTEIEKGPKTKKYAYIKNFNALIHSQKYDIEQKHSDQSNESQNYQISRTRLTQNSELATYQNTEHDPINSNKKPQNMSFASKNDEIDFLRQSLQEQRYKFQQFQQQTIKNQIKILDTITNLETKLKQLKEQNVILMQQNSSLKTQIQKNNLNLLSKIKKNDPHCSKKSFASEFDEIKELNFEIERLSKNLDEKQTQMMSLEHSYKKIKGVAKGLVDMMRKVDNLQTPQDQDETKYAWKWVKKVVWQYEAIRKKAYEWKKVYDELNKESQNQLSVSSEENY